MATMKVNSGIYLRDVGNEGILYDTWNKQVHVLNNTASLVWKQCCESRTTDQIAQSVSEQFQVPLEQALEDVQEIVATFTGLKLLCQS
jgi:Coenzyme PQQ synthesis protein D (PqqD)